MAEKIIKWLEILSATFPQTELYQCEHCKQNVNWSEIFQAPAHQLCLQCQKQFEEQGIISYKDLPQVSETCYQCGTDLIFCSDGWWRCPRCQWESCVECEYLEEED